MNTLQKGSAAVTALLVVILLIVLGVGSYMYMHRATTATPVVSTTPLPEPATSTAPSTTTAAPQPGTPALPPKATPNPIRKVYTDTAFGYSVSYPKTESASVDKNGTVTLFTLGSGLDPTIIAKATGSADTSTGKWGKNILSYSNSGWVTEMQKEDGTTYTAATVPFAFTAAGLPIFNGGTRHGFGKSVYVVALSQTKFLIISGPEGLTTATGYDYSTDAPLQIAKDILAIK